MLQKQYTKFLGTPVVNVRTGEKLGEIYDLIVDEQTGKVEAFWLKQGFMFGSSRILSVHDVVEWKIKIYINDPDAIVVPEEIVKVREILERGVPIYLNRVRTLSGQKIGKVIDFFFDPISGQILQLEIAHSLFGFNYYKRLVSFNEVYEITKKAVVLKDDYKAVLLKTKENSIDLSEAI